MWLGDVGGLIDGVFLIAEFIVLPFGSLALRQNLTKDLVRYEGSKSKRDEDIDKTLSPENQFLEKLRTDE